MSTGFSSFRWIVLITLCIDTAATAVALISPAPIMGPIAHTLGVSLGEATGTTMGTFNLFVGLSCIIGGWLLDQFGTVRVWLTCIILMIVGLLLIPVYGTTFLGLNVLRAIHGCATGPIMASAARVAATWFPSQERGIVTGFQGMSMGLGVAIGFMAAPLLYEYTGDWTDTMAWISVFSFIGLGLTVLVAVGPKAPLDQMASDRQGGDHDFRRALQQPATWAAIGCVVWLSWVYQGFNDLVPGYLAIDAPVGLGLGPVTAGRDMMYFQIAFMVGAVLSGFVAEKFFGGRSRPVVVLGFAVFTALAFSIKLSVVTSNSTVLMSVLMVTGFFQALVNPTTFAFIAKYYPEHVTGRIGGLTQGIGILGGTGGVFAGAYALHTTGLYFLSLTIVIVIGIIGMIFALGLKPVKVFTRTEKRLQLRG